MKVAAPIALVIACTVALAGCATEADNAARVPAGVPSSAGASTAEPEVLATPTPRPLSKRKLVVISMLTDDWLGIDGDLDNLADIAYTDGDSGLGDRAYAIRDAGNAQNPGWPSTAAGFDHWPAAGQMSEISLTRKQWLLVERTLIESASDYAAIAREAGQTTTDTKPNQDEDWLGMSDDCRRMARFIHRELTRR